MNEKIQGRIAYKYQINPDDNFYNETFWINIENGNCESCTTTYIICNEEFLGENFLELKNSLEVKNVEFSGDIKELCKKNNDITERNYNLMTLTSIDFI
ncbi:hypothetical protein [Gillisia sp. Hel_I_29]|uniref:hypothetical protein n=1 Tax=Gillisia sp. Hel_I_29 TaxID=1249975 RepID=UPI00054E23F4|nr:hypothetical protein [Gillisia sp. Hel_I_29]